MSHHKENEDPILRLSVDKNYPLLQDHSGEPDKAFLAVVPFFLAEGKYVLVIRNNQSQNL